MNTLLCALLLQQPVGGFSPEKHPVSPDGVRAVCDLPAGQHVRNTGGSDGAGLCVFTSMQMAADWQQLPDLAQLQAYMRKRPGGGYPEKVDAVLKAYCKEKGVPVPPYVQHTDGDEEFLDLAVKTGRMPCVTYGGRDDFYRTGIYHMVVLVHLDKDRACIQDNNRPGVFLWMTRGEFLTRWRSMQGGWAFVWTAPPPPPYVTKPRDEVVRNFGVTQAPKQIQPQGVDNNNYGVMVEKVRPSAKFSINGQEASRDAVFAALFNDANHLSVSAVVAEGQQSKVLDDLQRTIPSSDLAKIHLQVYTPADWEVTQFGLSGLTIRSVEVGRTAKDLAVLAAFTPVSAAEEVKKALNPPKPLPPPEPAPVPVDPPLVPSKPFSWAAASVGFIAGCVLSGLIVLVIFRGQKA